MARALRFTDRAIADLQDIQRWLTQPGSGAAARRKLRAIQATIKRLKRTPCLFPICDQPGVRELPCPGGYRALYEVHPDTGHNATAGDVMVLRVRGPGEDRRAADS